MILLELTEREACLITEAVQNSSTVWDYNSNGDESDRVRHIERCDSVLNKVEKSFVPKGDLSITHKDLTQIISKAKDLYVYQNANVQISNKKVEQCDLPHIALANVLIMWLNTNNLLKRLARFDYTDDSCIYEEDE